MNLLCPSVSTPLADSLLTSCRSPHLVANLCFLTPALQVLDATEVLGGRCQVWVDYGQQLVGCSSYGCWSKKRARLHFSSDVLP